MAWFKRKDRKQESGAADPVLASDEPVENWRRRVADAGLTFVRISRDEQGNTYQTLTGADPERAKSFLRSEPIDKERYHIVVDTPDGTWCTDILGLYLANLRPWQTDTATADCDGRISALIDGNQSMHAAATDLADNFVVQVTCGRCAYEWIDGVRYRALTLVRCPACRAGNRVDSGGYTISVHG